MRVLITGGAGFIGGNLARALAGAGHQVDVLDNLALAHSLALLGAPASGDLRFVHGDVRAREDFDRLPAGAYDRVYHLAASFANELSTEHPARDWRINVEGTRNALDFARARGCGLFVYAGSSSSYGAAAPPFREDDTPLAPHTPYAASKLAGELAVRASEVPWAVVRLFNVYGPGDPPGPYRNAVPNMLAALEPAPGVAADAPPPALTVYGAEATRDFTYVGDVVAVLARAERARGATVNVGTGRETRVLDLAPALLALRGLPADRLALAPQRAWDRVVRRCADVTRLRALFGPELVPATPLAEGLARTLRWLREAGYLRRGEDGGDHAGGGGREEAARP